ncbi:hypothetical protein BBI01_10050 [Chryseobacterium artocarpi]|uniref:Uncharacterized protein n=1 Tax=Chryseobacterium artocarpi TaxID=1414727 RepID=A0A1B8ZLJ5_9FLAO|nr:hypothetical protein [Chryseobacterium artocarpi]OCA72455.1 hypothetical protein BBI01_10050 [Chryseobacterium artocarpi]
MGKITIILMLFLIISCDRSNSYAKNDKNLGVFVKENTFISSPGIYYFRDFSIVVKEFKDDTIIYGVFDYYNNLLYQRNINVPISNYMKWTIYIDNQGRLWFYNTDYQETNILVVKRDKTTFVKDLRKLPPIPDELSKFIKE